MFFLIFKTILTAVVVVGVSEIAKRSSTFAAMLAALPLTSILAMMWLYFDTKDSEKIISLSYSIFWLVLPTLLFFIMLPFLLKNQLGFWFSMIGSCLVMLIFYLGYVFLGKKIGLPL